MWGVGQDEVFGQCDMLDCKDLASSCESGILEFEYVALAEACGSGCSTPRTLTHAVYGSAGFMRDIGTRTDDAQHGHHT